MFGLARAVPVSTNYYAHEPLKPTLKQQDEDEQVVVGRDDARLLPRRHHREGNGRHEQEALEHHDARAAEEPRVEPFKPLGEGAREDEEDAGDVGLTHDLEPIEERGERRALPEEEPRGGYCAFVGFG